MLSTNKGIEMQNKREGANHWQNKLREEDVRWMRKHYNPTKMSKTSLAEKFGVQLSTISRILSGDSWKHVKVENKFISRTSRLVSKFSEDTNYVMFSDELL